MNVSGKTKVFGVIGDPIEHTLSPALQNAAFEYLGLDCLFLAFHVAAGDAEAAMRGMRSFGISGLNVTMPHKKAVIPHLDEVNEIARVLGSVNTIFNQDGKLRGFSTDGAGAHRALEENGVALAGKKLVLFGAGGSAKAIAYAVAREVKELVMLNRNPEKLADLAEAINKKFRRKVTVASTLPRDIQNNLKDADVLVNATSVGMNPQAGLSLVAPEWLKPDLVVLDVVYDPLETKLSKDAKAAGAQVISGIEMLIYQGATSFEIWTGKPAPIKTMRTAVLTQMKLRKGEGDESRKS